MKAWLLEDFEGLEKLRLGEVTEPVPQAGEVVVKIRYAALNPADRYLAERQYPAKPPLPHILGRDGVGEIVRLGAGVTEVKVGRRYSILRGETGVSRHGTFAECVAVPGEDLVETPADWSDLEAAGATLVYLTAYQALTQWGDLAVGAVVLVTGASGGVGIAAVQLASSMGYRVMALSRSEDKRARLLGLGAEAAFDPEDPQWGKELRSALGDRRVDLAIDNIGGKLLPQVIATLGDNGRVSVVGRLGGPVPMFNTATLFFRRLRLGGVAVGAYTREESRAGWNRVLELLSRTHARPVVDTVFPFDHLPEAFARLAQGPMGKVVLKAP